MTELFVKLFNMGISAGWLILVVLILRLILTKAPKQLRLIMWGLVGLRLVCPFTLKSVFSLIPSADVLTTDIMEMASPAVNTGMSPLDDVINPILDSSFAPDPSWSANPLQVILPIIANIWFVVLLGFVVYTVVSSIVLDIRLRTAVKLRDNIYRSEKVTSPFVFGLRRLNIYVPFGMDDGELEYVIMHENAHIERLDHIIKPLGFAVLALHWYNPLVWLAYILLCRDIELACDERVISGLDDIGKADYSQTLLACSSGRRSVSACPIAFGEVGVKERVKSVLSYRKPALWVIVITVVLILLAAVFFMTDPIVLDIEDYNWRFSHVKIGDEYVSVAEEREHLYGITHYTNYYISVDGNTLYLSNNSSRNYFSLKLKAEDATPYTTLYSFNHEDTSGYVLLADIKSDADMSGGMVIVGSGDAVFGVPANEPTLVISIDGGEIYFYHDPNAEKYDPFAETQPVEIIEIVSHISDEKLSFDELCAQKDEIWNYHKKIMDEETDPVLRKWASKLATAWCDNNEYVIFEVRNYTEEDIARFEELFSHCSYIIRQINQ